MRRSVFRGTSLVAVALVVASCTDRSPTNAASARSAGASSFAPANACTTFSNLVTLLNALFASGSPNLTTLAAKLNDLQAQLAAGNTTAGQDQARSIVALLRQQAESGALAATVAQLQSFISSVLCYAGLSPDTFLVVPSDAPRVFVTADKKAGVSLQGNTVTAPTLITITQLPTDVSPLNTKLDVYPGFVLVTQSGPLTKAAVVGVCPSVSVPASVLPRLRLGHQKTTGFEITPSADASFLDCSSASASRASKWLQAVASLVLPKPLYAKVLSGGIGGLATEFSPFGPVDTEMRFSGGVGGTATEFQLPAVRDSNGVSRPAAATTSICPVVEAAVSGAVSPDCRPGVTLKTAKGTLLQNVPVNWAIGVGGGAAAPEASGTRSCGAFGATAATATDATAKAGVCWNLGPVAGTNTVIATPAVGGDVPPGVTFSPANITFEATARLITPTATATGGTFDFDGAGHPGSGTCSNNLTPALTYSGTGSVPVAAGSYTLTVTCGAGSTSYKSVTQTAAIEIKPAKTTTTVTCPTTVPFTGAPLTPCTAIVSGGGLTLSMGPGYTNNVNVGTATAVLSYGGDMNHLPSDGASTFKITGSTSSVAVTCPASVVFTDAPLTPCTAMVTGPGLSLSATPTYSSNFNVGTATATVAYAGDANHAASTSSATFSITAAPTVTSVNCPASVTFTGSPLTPCVAAATGPGLNLPITPTYASNVVAGTATVTASYPGGGNYLASNGSSSFQISGMTTTARVTCLPIALYTGSPVTPCTGLVEGDGLHLAVTPTYTSNVIGTATAAINYAGGNGYGPSSASKTFQIYYVQAGIFSAPLSSVRPASQSFITKGTPITASVTLLSVSGTGVTGASGSITVQDVGPNGTSTPVTVMSGGNAFSSNGGGSYSSTIATSGLASLHYYVVSASWNDGSRTIGWFYLK